MFKTDGTEGCEMDSTLVTTSFQESDKSHNIKNAAGKTRNCSTRAGTQEITMTPTWKTQTAVLY